ncbi:hypothetical protein [Halostagnicola bangensis]
MDLGAGELTVRDRLEMLEERGILDAESSSSKLGNDLGAAAMYLFTLCLLIRGAEWVVRSSRSGR